MLKLIALSVVLSMAAAPALAEADPAPRPASPREGGPRVRPYDARAASLLIDGLQRSATIRALVDALDREDLIVYVEMDPRLPHGLAGRLTWVAATPRFRYVRVSLGPTHTTAVLLTTLGHELQHALEIAGAPSIVDDRSLARYYEANGILMTAHNNGWDTTAAREAGALVRRELADADRGREGMEMLTSGAPRGYARYSSSLQNVR